MMMTIRTNAALEEMEARTQYLEVCGDRQWAVRFSGVDFDAIDQDDRERAAAIFNVTILDALEDAGLLWLLASADERSVRKETCEEWNAKSGLRHRIGPIGACHELSVEEIAQLEEIVRTAEARVHQEFCPDTKGSVVRNAS